MINDDILINRLVKLSFIILNIYDDLAKVEINSLEYETLSKKLDNYKGLEDDIYNKLDPNKLYDYEESILTMTECDFLNDYELLSDGTEFELVIRHIYNKLEYLREKYQVLNYQNSYISLEATIPFDSKFYLENSIHEDFLNLFIFKLEEIITKLSSYNYQDKLKEIIHLLINLVNFLTPINLTFNKEYLFLNSKSLATILGIRKYYNKFMNEYFILYIKPALISLLTTQDTDYQNPSDTLRTLINITLIKSYLEFNNDKIKDITIQFHDIMKLYNKNNNKSITILEDLLQAKADSKILMMELRGIYEYEDSKIQRL